MQQPDVTGNLYRFLCSFGVLLIGASIAGPWLFSQSIAVLTVPTEELDRMTPTAREAILNRQKMIGETQSHLPIIALGIFVVGVLVLLVGIYHWWKRQKGSDQNEDREWASKRADYEKASDADIESKLEHEVSDDSPSFSTPSTSSPALPKPASSGPDRITRLKEDEARAFDLARQSFTLPFSVNQNVRVASRSTFRAIFDILLDPSDDSNYGQLGIDIKHVSNPGTLNLRVWDSMIRMAISSRDLKHGTVPREGRGRPPKAFTTSVLLFILEDESQFDRAKGRIRDLAAEANGALARPISVRLITRSEFLVMTPAEFRATVVEAWEKPL